MGDRMTIERFGELGTVQEQNVHRVAPGFLTRISSFLCSD